MTTDYRALCAELLAAIQLYTKLNPAASDMSPFELTKKLMDAMAATVAALAEPDAEGPTDEELEKLAEPFSFVAEGGWDRSVYDETGYARAVLARWGRPTPQPPADGEVAEVAAWLRLFCSEEYASRSHDPDVAWLTRAADLLEAHALPTPDATDD